VDAEFLRLPEFAYLRYATVQDDNYVRLELFTDTKHDVGTYVLKRALDTNDVYTTVNVFHAPDPKIPSDSITPMSDRSPITDRHQYYYKVDMFDTCGAYMTTSNFNSTMLLKITVDNVRRVNRLEWTNVWGWWGKTFAYRIYRFLDGVQLKDPLTKFPDSAATTVFYDSLLLINDNITQGNPSRGKYTYYIEALENEPSFRGSPPAISTSNEVTVVQQPYIASANAFTPNGDGKNEKFKPIVTYHDLSKYEFYVMNRFGDIIYSTNNAKASWDGTYNGKPVPQGVYVYSVKYQSSTGQQFEDRGTVSVLR
jgi:gliding motility-associated-like protein